MDVIDHLIEEHRKTEQLLQQLAGSEAGEDRRRTLDELESALSTHMAVEERFVYPIVQRVVGDDDEAGAENEHGLARDGLAAMRRLVDEPGFGAAVEMVQAGIRHHVEEEEGEIFPELRQHAADDVAALGSPDDLERQVQAGRDRTKAELYEEAQRADIEGRSSMSKDELIEAVDRASGEPG